MVLANLVHAILGITLLHSLKNWQSHRCKLVATFAVNSNSLRQKRYSILVNALENYAHGNGISVFLHAAQLLRSLGLSVSIVPADSSTPRFIRLPFGQSLEMSGDD